VTHRPSRLADFFDNYTKDLTAEDLQRLFTRDTRDAYKFFTRGRDADAMQRMPWHRRAIAEARILFLAFSMKLSPARRVVFGAALLLAVIGLFNLFRGVGIIEILHQPTSAQTFDWGGTRDRCPVCLFKSIPCSWL